LGQHEEVQLSPNILDEEEIGHDQAFCFELLALQVISEAHLDKAVR